LAVPETGVLLELDVEEVRALADDLAELKSKVTEIEWGMTLRPMIQDLLPAGCSDRAAKITGELQRLPCKYFLHSLTLCCCALAWRYRKQTCYSNSTWRR
jgi:hypothetical protein